MRHLDFGEGDAEHDSDVEDDIPLSQRIVSLRCKPEGDGDIGDRAGGGAVLRVFEDFRARRKESAPIAGRQFLRVVNYR